MNKYDKLETPILFDEVMDVLYDKKLIKNINGKKNMYMATKYGRAVSLSFLKIYKAEYIKKHLKQDPLVTVEKLEPFDSAYLSSRLINRLSSALKTNVSSRLFADSTRDIITSFFDYVNKYYSDTLAGFILTPGPIVEVTDILLKY